MNHGNSAQNQSQRLYQAVRCGELRVAFPYGWANSIVESFVVTPVPKAPAWLLGATNIDGRIFPVVDLAHYGATAARAKREMVVSGNAKPKRLLIGGVNGDNDDYRLGIAFDELPQQIGHTVEKFIPSAVATNSTPGLTDGSVELAHGARYALVNIERLFARLSVEISTL